MGGTLSASATMPALLLMLGAKPDFVQGRAANPFAEVDSHGA